MDQNPKIMVLGKFMLSFPEFSWMDQNPKMDGPKPFQNTAAPNTWFKRLHFKTLKCKRDNNNMDGPKP